MPAKPSFRICLILPENYPHSLCFREVGLLLLASLKELGYECDFQFNQLAEDRTNIILGSHLLTFAEGLRNYRYLPWQLEQLHSAEYPFSQNQEQLLRHAAAVWDYSDENISFFFAFLQVPDVTHMDQVEASVGEDNAVSCQFMFFDGDFQLVER